MVEIGGNKGVFARKLMQAYGKNSRRAWVLLLLLPLLLRLTCLA